MKAKAILDYPLDKIKFDENNPNVTSIRDEEASKAFLKKYDILRAVVVDAKGLCIDGEHIARRAIERGDKTIPVLQADPKNPGEIAEIRTFLNYGPRGKPDEEKFAHELEKIYKAGNIGGFAETMGRSVDEFRRSLEALRPKDPSAVPTEAPAVAQTGEIYRCGRHYVMCGDGLSPDDYDYLVTIADGIPPRLILTDPPYDLKEYDYLTPFLERERDIEIMIMTDDKGAVEFANRIKKWFIGYFPIQLNSSGVVAYGNQPRPEHRLINHYRKGNSNFKNLHDAFGTVHEIVTSKSGITRHEKPLELPRKLIVHYTKPLEVVLDFFAGSGSTMIACEQLERVCYSIENDPHKVDIILKRYEEFSHEKPVKVS